MPSKITNEFKEFCGFGRAVSVILPVDDRGVKNVFVVVAARWMLIS